MLASTLRKHGWGSIPLALAALGAITFIGIGPCEIRAPYLSPVLLLGDSGYDDHLSVDLVFDTYYDDPDPYYYDDVYEVWDVYEWW